MAAAAANANANNGGYEGINDFCQAEWGKSINNVEQEMASLFNVKKRDIKKKTSSKGGGFNIFEKYDIHNSNVFDNQPSTVGVRIERDPTCSYKKSRFIPDFLIKKKPFTAKQIYDIELGSEITEDIKILRTIEKNKKTWKDANRAGLTPELYFAGYLKRDNGIHFCVISDAYDCNLKEFMSIQEFLTEENINTIRYKIWKLTEIMLHDLKQIFFDIKPENIVIKMQENVVVDAKFIDMDWGMGVFTPELLNIREPTAAPLFRMAAQIMMVVQLANFLYKFHNYNFFANDLKYILDNSTQVNRDPTNEYSHYIKELLDNGKTMKQEKLLTGEEIHAMFLLFSHSQELKEAVLEELIKLMALSDNTANEYLGQENLGDALQMLRDTFVQNPWQSEETGLYTQEHNKSKVLDLMNDSQKDKFVFMENSLPFAYMAWYYELVRHDTNKNMFSNLYQNACLFNSTASPNNQEVIIDLLRGGGVNKVKSKTKKIIKRKNIVKKKNIVKNKMSRKQNVLKTKRLAKKVAKKVTKRVTKRQNKLSLKR